ncbi:MAG: T9SS type A sorting domain-containing protein, partial [Calditrichaeota bacterium]|nr:T9SS type A sorting domain-containing protein [Calditrichota bacterium]
SQETLYEGEAVDVDVQQGRLNWASQSMTLVHIDVPGVFSLVSDPTSVHVVEGDLAELQLVPNNPPVDDMIFAIVDRDGVGGELDDEGHFEWQTSPGDAGDYYPVFSLTDPNDEDVMDSVTVWIEVIDRNFPPVYGDPPGEGWIFEENVWWYHIPEDNGDNPDAWFTIIADLNQFCTDVDEDRLTFFTRPSDPENRVLCEIVAQESVRVRVDLENEVNDNANWYGNVLCTIVAEDGVDEERDHYSRTLRMIGNISHDANERTLRSTGNRTPSSGPRRDVSTDFEFFLVVDPINDLPEAEAEADAHNEGVWRFYEGVEDSYLVLATDVEDDPNELRWSVVDEQIPEGAEFIDNEDSTGTFTWEPGFDAAGDYTAIFQVVDTDEDTTEITVNIVVDDVNQVPGLTGELPDLVFDEDTGPHVLVEDLFPLFEDLDNDEIRFTVSCDVEELGVEYVDGAINATPVPHWNGEADVVVTVQDFLNDVPRGDPVDYPFHVTITSINDAPGGEDGFILVTPADNDPFTDEMETLNFSWTEAVQVPFEGDDVVTYVFVARIADSPEDTIAIPDLDAIEYNDVNVREVVAQLGIEEEDFQIHVVVEWNVYAVDTEGAFAEASNSWFRIDVNLAVDDPEASLIPEDYYLSPNFPNPFNARTTVRFGLPTAGDVQVMVWDMHGRQVANLASGYHAAGRFEVVWDAGQIPTGVYVIRLTSGDARIMQKAILLK